MNRKEMNEVYNLKKEIQSIERVMRTLPPSDELNKMCEKYDRTCRAYMRTVERCEEQIQKLPNSKLRCAFRMRYIEGLTWQEIADEMGEKTTVDSVKKLVYRQFSFYEKGDTQ